MQNKRIISKHFYREDEIDIFKTKDLGVLDHKTHKKQKATCWVLCYCLFPRNR